MTEIKTAEPRMKEPKMPERKTPEPRVPEPNQTERRSQERMLRRLPGREPILRFTPTAWAKLLFFRDYGDTEVGGFAVTSPDDLLLVTEFVPVKQEVTIASVSFHDDAVAEFFDAQVDLGRRPEQFARIWLHTHPGDSPCPSCTDEATFGRVFGACQWAVMFIIAQRGKTYARLRFNVGPGGHIAIPVDVDFSTPFGPSQREAWEAEYKATISQEGAPFWSLDRAGDPNRPADLAACSVPDNWLEELEAMEPAERQLVMDELAARPDLWGGEGEALL
jgi:proteasome lid subunit RPN8/RPN11